MPNKNKINVLLGIGVLVFSFVNSALANSNATNANITSATVNAPEYVPDQYIVLVKPDSSEEESGRIRNYIDRRKIRTGNVRTTNASTSSQISSRAILANITKTDADELAKDSAVQIVEQDQIIHSQAVENNADWGLDRIDQHDLPLDTNYNYDTTGAGVNAYILDTGINSSNSEFSGRIGNGYDFIDNDTNPEDCMGHGTHVAGIIGGTTYGVAKNVTLHPVRIMDCNGAGYLSGVISGIDWITKNHSGPSVVNMSITAATSQALNDAIQSSINSGVNYVVAAGNSNADACSYSPASAPNAITVGSTNSSDNRSSFSNYGSCVDIFAPGEMIKSAYTGGANATQYMSGTSMASPHVAGAVARYLSQNPSASPSEVTNYIKSNATQNKVLNAGGGSANLLLYMGNGNSTATPPPTNNPPTTNPPVTNPPVTNTPAPTPAPNQSANVELNLYKYNLAAGRFYDRVVVTVRNSQNQVMQNVKVNLQASGLMNGTAQASTNSSGQVTFTTYSLSGTGVINFTVTGLTDASGNKINFSSISKSI